jgi:hypothetical protein
MASPTQHAWKELALSEGKVWRKTPGKPDAEYLATPAIEIVAKKQAVPEREDPRVAFHFELNAAPDPIWQQLFSSNLEQIPTGVVRSEITVTFHEKQMRLLCLASHLERIYPFVKVTIAKTNSDYEAEKPIVLAHLQTAERYKQSAKLEPATKTELAQEKLTQLDL